MTSYCKAALAEIAQSITALAVTLRDKGKQDGLTDRERQGIEVMAMEMDAIVEGLQGLYQPVETK